MSAAKHTVVIGIDAYGSGIATLKSAVSDARAIADALERDHGYGSPHRLLDGEATGAAVLRLLEETLPAAVQAEDSVILYYAGHGVALGDGSEGPEGFLLPQDARAGDESTWLPMTRVRQALSRLPCKHLLVVLDCCFAGSFRWASSRSIVPIGRPLYDSQYRRFIKGTAWQVLTSASHQERALDVAPGCRNTRDAAENGHSPFAAALLRGLGGEADSTRGSHSPDGVITATELHQFVFEELVPREGRSWQTPGIWPLRSENTGEFVFTAPGREVRTRPDPPLDDANNPWLGLQAYGRKDAALFFGRERVVREVIGRLLDPARSPLLVVVGASGTGKSSVLRAGVLPRLEQPSEELAERTGPWSVARLPRLEGDPRPELEAALATLAATAPTAQRKLLFIDQFEELYTQCPDGDVRRAFLRRLQELISGEPPLAVVLTLRSDFEPRLAASEELGPLLAASRYLVPAMTSEEYRDVIEEPAKAKALYFEPEALVGELVDEVMAMPGGLPLLSFALSEMYRQAQLRRRETGALDRALTREDYAAAGGVVGALHRRANELYKAEDEPHRQTIRRLFLRLVAQEGGRLARRRVERRELEYPDAAEQERVRRVLEGYVEARLLVADEGHVEPAHDTLVLAWEKLLDWLAAAGSQELLRQLWGAASAWETARREKGEKRAAGLLWNQDPRLPLIQDRYLRERPGELNRLESEFAAGSVARKRRRRNLVAAVTAGVVLALSGATWYSLRQAALAEARAEEARLSTERERTAKERAQDVAGVAVARDWLERDPTRAAVVLLEVTRPNATPFAAERLREALVTPLSAAVLRGHRARVMSAAFSPDGRRIVTTSEDGTARVWRVDGSGGPVILRGHRGMVLSAAFSPDGRRVVTASADGTARVWPADGAGEPVVLRGHESGVVSAAFGPDGRRVVTASEDGTARVWAADGSGEPVVLRGHRDHLWSAAFSPDGRRIVTASHDETARVWAADGSGEPVVLSGHDGIVMGAAFSPDGGRVVTVSGEAARVWAADGAGEPVALVGHEDAVLSAAFSPDGRRVVTTSHDHTARLWPADGAGEPVVLRGHQDFLMGADFSPDGRRIVTASNDHTARIWPVEDAGEPVVLRGHGEWVRSAGFSPDGRRIVTASHDGTARVWAADGSGKPVVLRGHRRAVESAAFSPDGRRVVTASGDGTARVWAADGSGEPVILRDPQGTVRSATFSADGRRVLTVSDAGTARVWPADGVAPPVVLRGHQDMMMSAVFSSDGRRALTASADGTARIWAANGSGRPVVLRGHADIVLRAVFSPDGKRVATASSDQTARVWAADGSGRPVVLAGHEGAVASAAFSPDGKRALSPRATTPRPGCGGPTEGFSRPWCARPPPCASSPRSGPVPSASPRPRLRRRTSAAGAASVRGAAGSTLAPSGQRRTRLGEPGGSA